MTKDRRFPWGISLLVFGFMFLLRQLGVFSPEVDDLIFDFRNILLVLGVIFLLTYRNKSIGIILLAVWALFYLKDIIILSRSLSDFIWPVLLIAAGILLLFSSVKLKNGNNNDSSNENNDATKMQ